jgi:hypothetical protein
VHVLTGCHSLPFSGGKADLLPVNFYRVTVSPSAICFRRLGNQSTCAPVPGQTAQYGNPIIDTGAPRSGRYGVIYYAQQHYWLFVSGCPVTPSP